MNEQSIKDYLKLRVKRVKQYFALCAEFGVSGDKAKDTAKRAFKADSFNELTVAELEKLIDILLAKKETSL